MDSHDAVIPSDIVDDTIEHFTKLDHSGDKRSMNKMARRLGKEQPMLLAYAAGYKNEHGDVVGEAAVFYCTLVWAIFDRHFGRKLHRLTGENIEAAKAAVSEERGKVEGLAEQPVHKQYAATLAEKQPYVYAKLEELIEEDVREEAMTAECATTIFEPAQVVVEAFDAVASGRRPGERQGPLVRETPKVGRNDACPCGSGKKYKKCHGVGA